MFNAITVFYDDEVGSQLVEPTRPPAPVFPTTPILDSFNRANEDPVANGWLGPILPTFNTMKVVGSALQQSMILGKSGNSYWAVSNFGPGSECYVTFSTVWNNTSSSFWLYSCGRNENTGTQGGYQLFLSMSSGVWVWQIYRMDLTNSVQLGADLGTQAIGDGDSIGLAVAADGTIQAWYKATGSSWATLGSTRTDTTYTSGHIGVAKGFLDTTSILDDFGGGTSVASTGFFLDDMADIARFLRKPELW